MVTIHDNITGEILTFSSMASAKREAQNRINYHGSTFSGRRYTHYPVECVMEINNNEITIRRK